jgi:hypothetical protein
MIVRIWRTEVAEARVAAYERFAATESLPMFRAQVGNLGVLFARDGSSCAVVSFWDSMGAIESLGQSATYRSTVDRIMAAGFITQEPTTEVLVCHGGWMSPDVAKAVASAAEAKS